VRTGNSLLLAVTAVTVFAQTADYSAPGRYGFTYRTEDIPGTTETMRNSRIYYPDSNGTFPQSAVPAPIGAFGHGWQMGIDRYYSYARILASWGYVVVLPTYSNPLINPEHDKRARLMADAARRVADRDTLPGDRFYRRLDRRNWGFAGHSLGGAISLLAADTLGLADTLRAVVALASPQTTPPTRSARLYVPKIIMPGSVDNIAPWTGVREAFWDQAPAPGTFAVIRGANHGFFMDFSYFWENGGTATISRDTQQMVVRRHMTACFERHLHGDSSIWNFAYLYGDSILHHPTMDSVEVRLPAVGVEQPFLLVAGGFLDGPSPVRGRVRIRYGLARAGRVTLSAYDARGGLVRRLVDGRREPGVHHATWDALQRAGTYFLRLESGGRAVTHTIIVLN